MKLLMLLHFTMTSPADVIALVDVIALHDDFFSFILFLYRVRHLWWEICVPSNVYIFLQFEYVEPTLSARRKL